MADSAAIALPRVDIVIPALDEEQTIADCVRAIKQQDYPANLVSLYVVIDARTSDRTAAVAQASGATVIECATSGTAAVRTRGVQQGSAELVGFLDAHCIVTPGWLKSMVQPFADESIGGCQGPLDVTYESKLVERFAQCSAFAGDQRLRDHTVNGLFSPYPWLLGGNCIFRRRALQAAGAFRNCSSEDTDCSWSVFLLGYQFAYVPAARALHHDRASIWDYLKKHYRHGVGAAQLAYSYGFGGKRPEKEKSTSFEALLLDLLYQAGSFAERGRQRCGKITLPKRSPRPVEDRFRPRSLWSTEIELQISPYAVHWSSGDDQTVVVHLQCATRLVLDGVGNLIFRQLANGSDRMSTCQAIEARYQTATASVQSDVDCFIEELWRENLLLMHKNGVLAEPEKSAQSNS